MTLRLATGGLMAIIGIGVLAFGALGLTGPVFYWANPFEAEALKLPAMIVGVSAVLLGAVVLASTISGRRRAR